KGRGGALLREKVLAQASGRYVIMVDPTKHVERLGSRGPVPVEVLPFAVAPVAGKLRDLGARVRIRTVEKEPFLTDQHNMILDCDFGPLEDPRAVARQMESVAGVLEHGLFLGFRATILTGTAAGVERREPS
ncbi:MAG: ribose-5-phosphate isomerase A, partial [Gemmatimonadales bacterium]